MPFTGFRGFCGETSHQTKSSRRRFIASMLTCRCPSCAGLNEPPRRPMRRVALGIRDAALGYSSCVNIKYLYLLQFPNPRSFAPVASLGPYLPVAFDHVFIRGELFHAHGAARVQAAGGDTDFRAEAELAAIGELCGSIVQHDGR